MKWIGLWIGSQLLFFVHIVIITAWVVAMVYMGTFMANVDSNHYLQHEAHEAQRKGMEEYNQWLQKHQKEGTLSYHTPHTL